jgi:hypothetical protein
MKTMRKLLVFAGTIFAAAFLQAQVIPDFMAVDARYNNVQTGWSSTTPQTYSAGTAGPYSFEVSVESNAGNLSGNTAPTFTLPGGATYAGSTTLAPNGTDWRRSAYYSSSPFTTDFPNGTYTITQPGASPGTVTLNLAGDFFPITPSVTITGGSGTWVGSVLQVTAGTTLTLTTNSFGWDGTGAETNGALANHIGLFLSHNGTEVANVEQFSNGAAPYFSSGTGNPNFATISNYTFTSGGYFVEVEFNAISSIDQSYVGATGVALYTSRTSFNIQVVPEPSTYAEILGVVALTGAMLHRRRRLV